MIGDSCRGIELRAEEIIVKVVMRPLIAIAQVKLQVAELEIGIKYFGCRSCARKRAGF
jgi:hypothetical protein